MTKRKEHHVVPNGDNGWAVRRNGSERASGVYPTKQQAVDAGREMSRNAHTELVVHNKDGKIARPDSHGHDPCPPKDRT